MEETTIKELQDSALAMYLGLNALYELHSEVELDSESEKVASCLHCSALADGIVAYPCPSVQVLLTDFQEIIDQSFEPAESEEPSA
jgi:hypothetical protein